MQANKQEDYEIESRDDEIESDDESNKSYEGENTDPKVVKDEKESESENSFEALDEENMTEEEIKELNEKRKEKQHFLKEKIIKQGYEPAVFSDYICELKTDGKIFFI